MSTKLTIALLAAAGPILLTILFWLGAEQAGGPPHREYQLEGEVPATLYMPDIPELSPSRSTPPPLASRPPALVLAHGFMSDRAGMSPLARSLALAGYAVLSIDLHGHGANRNAFTRPGKTDSFLVQDLAVAVDFLRNSPLVDGSRIAVAGHSMGAGAALSFGTVDPAIDGLIMISGGREMMGSRRPRNALFIIAEGDSDRLRERVHQLAAPLAAVSEIEAGKIYGDFRPGTAVRVVEVPGSDHVTILFSSEAVTEIVDWLDRIFEVEREVPAVLVDPRLRLAGLGFLAFLVLLPGIGAMAARLAPEGDVRDVAGTPMGLLTLAVALVLGLPFFATGSGAMPLMLEAGDVLGAYLGVSGVFVLVSLTLRGGFQPRRLGSELLAALLPALLALLVVYLVLNPLGVVLHLLSPTPERMAVGILYALVLFPFALALQQLLRRGSVLRASLFSLAGRLLVLVSIVVGVQIGVIASVVMLIVPIVAILLAMFEIVSCAIYATSRNLVLAALVEAGWLAWVMSVSLPIRV